MGDAVNRLAARMIVQFASIHVVVPPHIRMRNGNREDVDGYEYDRDVKTGREIPGSRQPLPKQGAVARIAAKVGIGKKQEVADTPHGAMTDFAAKNAGWKVSMGGRQLTNGDVTIDYYGREVGNETFTVTHHEDKRSYDFKTFQEAIEHVRPKGSSDDEDRKWFAHIQQQTRDVNDGINLRDAEGNPLFRRDSTGKAVMTEHHPAQKEATAKKAAERAKAQEEYENPDPTKTGTEVEKFASIFAPKSEGGEKTPGLSEDQLSAIQEAAVDVRNGDFKAALEKLDAVNKSPEMRKLSDWAFEHSYQTPAEKKRQSTRLRGSIRHMQGALGGPNGWQDWLNQVRAAANKKTKETKP